MMNRNRTDHLLSDVALPGCLIEHAPGLLFTRPEQESFVSTLLAVLQLEKDVKSPWEPPGASGEQYELRDHLLENGASLTHYCAPEGSNGAVSATLRSGNRRYHVSMSRDVNPFAESEEDGAYVFIEDRDTLGTERHSLTVKDVPGQRSVNHSDPKAGRFFSLLAANEPPSFPVAPGYPGSEEWVLEELSPSARAVVEVLDQAMRSESEFGDWVSNLDQRINQKKRPLGHSWHQDFLNLSRHMRWRVGGGFSDSARIQAGEKLFSVLSAAGFSPDQTLEFLVDRTRSEESTFFGNSKNLGVMSVATGAIASYVQASCLPVQPCGERLIRRITGSRDLLEDRGDLTEDQFQFLRPVVAAKLLQNRSDRKQTAGVKRAGGLS